MASKTYTYKCPQHVCVSCQGDEVAFVVTKGQVRIVEEDAGATLDRAWENVLNALRSFDAQKAAAALLKAKRMYEVKVVLAGKDGKPIPVDTASLG